VKAAGDVIFRCGPVEHRLPLSSRDIHLLDGEFFLSRTANYRAYLGLDFIKGLGAPPEGQVLKRHRRLLLADTLKGLLVALEDQRDLISFSYQYRFSAKPDRSGGGGCSGFRVRGLFGFISAEPSGYCTLRLSELAPTGRGRLVEVIDMRSRKSVDTDDWGTLSISRRHADVGWFEQLPRVLSWLAEQQATDVEVLHGCHS
jgi:hypothetical protein